MFGGALTKTEKTNQGDVLVNLDDSKRQYNILNETKELRRTEKHENTYIAPDITRKRRKERKKPREELNRRSLGEENPI